MEEIDSDTLRLLLSKDWVTTVKRFTFSIRHDSYSSPLTADDLRGFLQALEKGGVVKKLNLGGLPFSSVLVEAFKGIRLLNLKELSLHNIRLMDDNEQVYHHQADVSELTNVLFESCSFPKLRELTLESDVSTDGTARTRQTAGLDISNYLVDYFVFPDWVTPPTKPLHEAFPLLEEFSLTAIDRSLAVTSYLQCISKKREVNLNFSDIIREDMNIPEPPVTGIVLNPWYRQHHHYSRDSSDSGGYPYHEDQDSDEYSEVDDDEMW